MSVPTLRLTDFTTAPGRRRRGDARGSVPEWSLILTLHYKVVCCMFSLEHNHREDLT